MVFRQKSTIWFCTESGFLHEIILRLSRFVNYTAGNMLCITESNQLCFEPAGSPLG